MNNYIRQPAVAGSFYPSNPVNLKAQVQTFLDSAEAIPVKGNLIGLIVPHAGYVYSGQVAAYSYALLKGKKISTAIIIGPAHHYPVGSSPSIYLKGKYKTPLGEVTVDEVLANKIKEKLPFMSSIPEAHAKEHSIEVQIPFLQVVLKDDFKIVPILTQQINDKLLTKLPDFLYNLLKTDKSLIIIASTDLSHYPTQEDASIVDKETIRLCGLGPVAILIETVKKFTKSHITLLNYKNSGDVSWIKERCVGYGAFSVSVE